MVSPPDRNHEMIVEILRLRAVALKIPEGSARDALFAVTAGIEEVLKLALQGGSSPSRPRRRDPQTAQLPKGRSTVRFPAQQL